MLRGTLSEQAGRGEQRGLVANFGELRENLIGFLGLAGRKSLVLLLPQQQFQSVKKLLKMQPRMSLLSR